MYGTPTASNVYVSVVPRANGKARAVVVETTLAGNVTVDDVFHLATSNIALCVAPEVVAVAFAETKMLVSDCLLSHEKTFAVLAYITDDVGSYDGSLVAMPGGFTVAAGTWGGQGLSDRFQTSVANVHVFGQCPVTVSCRKLQSMSPCPVRFLDSHPGNLRSVLCFVGRTRSSRMHKS